MNFSGVVSNALERDIVGSEFKLYLRYHVNFRTNNLQKGVNLLIHPRYGLNSTTTVQIFYFLS